MKMSRKASAEANSSLHKVVVESKDKPRRHTNAHIHVIEKGVVPKVSSMSSDFVYVNSAYTGSVNSVNEPRVSLERPTSVIREQYWACSKWPFAQRVLVIAVGVLLGAVVGLAVSMALRSSDKDAGSFDIFRTHAVPD